jgi:hypothetical protein
MDRNSGGGAAAPARRQHRMAEMIVICPPRSEHKANCWVANTEGSYRSSGPRMTSATLK